MSTDLARSEPGTQIAPEILEQVVAGGDLSKLTAAQRVAYYRATCQSVRLNPLTRPFQYITLNSRLTLYCTRDATDQLARLHRVTRQVASRERLEDIYVVTARCSTPDGRSEESIGAVTVGGLKGDALCNALMKAETKAKRRATLSLVGLGWLDETEIETIPDASPARIDVETGEVLAPGADRNGRALTVAAAAPAESMATLVAQYRTLVGRCQQEGVSAGDIRELTGTVRRPQLEPEITRLQQLLAAVQGTPPPETEAER